MKIIKRVHKSIQRVISLEEYRHRKKEDERVAILNKLIKEANELPW